MHFSFLYAGCNQLYKKYGNRKKNDLVDNVQKKKKLRQTEVGILTESDDTLKTKQKNVPFWQ